MKANGRRTYPVRMFARWLGTCRYCAGAVRVGDELEYWGTRGDYGHPGCRQMAEHGMPEGGMRDARPGPVAVGYRPELVVPF